jgi:hypothetical protein
MAQITGRRLPHVKLIDRPLDQEYRPASVWPFDAHNNGALTTMDMPIPITRRIDSTDPLVTYVGMCAPELANPAEPTWLVERITDDGLGNVIVEHAYVPASGGLPARYSTAEHIWNARAALQYA